MISAAHDIHDESGKGDEPTREELTHVGQLLRRYGKGRSVRQIERDNDLSNGSLSRFANPDWDGNEMQLRVLHRFVDALGAPIEEVSAAFARDIEIPLEGRKLSREEEELLDDFAAVPPAYRAVVRRMIKAAGEEFTTREERSETSSPIRK